MNGGTCVEDGDKFKCVCLPWTSGNLCEGNVNINKIYTNFIKFLLLYSFEILWIKWIQAFDTGPVVGGNAHQ